MGTPRAHAKAWSTGNLGAPAALARRLLAGGVIALTGMGGVGGALAATPANTPITNIASATYSISGTPITVTGSVTVLTAARPPATIEFMQYVSSTDGLPAGVAISQNVPVTQCNAGAGFNPLPTPALPGGRSLAVPGSQLLAPASLYASGDTVFVRVTDYDQNIDPLVAETVVVTVSSNGVDTESLRLTETGPSTGVFIGYIPAKSGAAQSGNCLLNVGGNHRLLATYKGQSAGSIAVTAAALVDPFGLVFDASTGRPVNGAQITLINMATGQPATVLGDDGTSSFPSTVTSGGSVTDSGGAVYAFAPGRYQFPRIAPGSYRLALVPPAGYVFPSLVPTPALQALPGGPFLIVTGSRGETFPVLPGPALEIDMPLDPLAAAGVQITKSAGKASVAIGEFVPYTVTINNGSKSSVAGVRIADRLPVGFRYQAGSARLDKTVLADPQISTDGRGLEFSIGTLPGSGALSLRYVAGGTRRCPGGPGRKHCAGHWWRQLQHRAGQRAGARGPESQPRHPDGSRDAGRFLPKRRQQREARPGECDARAQGRACDAARRHLHRDRPGRPLACRQHPARHACGAARRDQPSQGLRTAGLRAEHPDRRPQFLAVRQSARRHPLACRLPAQESGKLPEPADAGARQGCEPAPRGTGRQPGHQRHRDAAPWRQGGGR
ncbi:DUF11 domain-containing protein [Polaromonas sp. P2-4]|nr:DUF11 domain-containing protein [Polaromonas sp. P2-4]